MVKPMVLYMHVSKTGGTTLNEIFARQYKNHEIIDHESYDDLIALFGQLSQPEKLQIRAVSGHYLYGIHEHLNPPVTYFTMLREPVDRVLSLYYFLQEHPNPEIKDVDKMSLKQFVNLTTPAVRAHQLQHLSGKPVNLASAKENLVHHFAIVGLTEMFDESIFLMKKRFGWGDISYTKKNVTKNRLKTEEVPKDTLDLIKKNLAPEIELYSLAKQIFLKKLSALSRLEKEELKAFKERQRTL